jgi:hypothetical protein
VEKGEEKKRGEGRKEGGKKKGKKEIALHTHTHTHTHNPHPKLCRRLRSGELGCKKVCEIPSQRKKA